ncbi:hypothetical protein [Psychromonas antarctica]|uniref:hypothetical protein n=1 Tax=Psychromonas antarctica TaxID=67573 RepID=UPI001EE8B26E|nr:hypothetical protein [Psychromonas antarctica]MCG6202024.1 hypothetical protein [Psychromonas antarctica]
MGFDSIFYLTDPYGDILFKMSFKGFLFALLVATVFLIFIIIFLHNKVSKNYERAWAEKRLSDNNKEHEALRMKHFKIRDELIFKDSKNTDTIKALKQEISRLENKVTKANEDKDDAIFASKRRAKKIKKMEMVLQLDIEGSEAFLNKQLKNPKRSLSSITNSYDWSKVDL